MIRLRGMFKISAAQSYLTYLKEIVFGLRTSVERGYAEARRSDLADLVDHIPGFAVVLYQVNHLLPVLQRDVLHFRARIGTAHR